MSAFSQIPRNFLQLAIALFLLQLPWCAAGFAAERSYWGHSEKEVVEFAARALGSDDDGLRIADGEGTIRRVVSGGETLGYLGSTWDVAHTAGYSGRPIDILVLVDDKAVIRGTLLLAQQEPVLTLGIAPADIEAYVSAFAGYDLREPLAAAGEKKKGLPDAIAGATLSSGVIRSGIVRTGRTIATAYRLLGTASGAMIDTAHGEPMSWEALIAAKAVVHLRITAAEADKAIGIPGNAEPASTFIDLHAAILDPPRIGASLLGEAGFSSLMGAISATDHVVWVAANGLYSFKGTGWRTSGRFDRIELVQADKTIAITKEQHRPLDKLAANGAPEFRELGLFVIPATTGFDPALPFSIALVASRDDAAGTAKSARFVLDYALPRTFLVEAAASPAAAAETPLWQENWEHRIPAIVTVAAMLFVLYLILIFQNQIAERPRLYQAIRIGYLSATVVILGVLIGAQLSVVHVLTFLQALRTQFAWESFLLDPVIFIIWGWVAVAMLFWGRVYCGWLCPFGALQELLNKAAQRLGIRQISIPFAVHERLWPLKYIAFLGIFAVSLATMTQAFRCAEIEPFKTVVTLHFMRPWPYVLFAAGLLAAGLFIERFYCRYLCPLGAAIALPARLRMFEWLKRRPQCGRECRICATKCPVQAIHPEGHINPNECIYCFNCQTLYFNEHICPPLKVRAARRAAYAAAPSSEVTPS